MNVCILVPAADVEKVKDTAAKLDFFAGTARDKLMNIALSENGKAPASHYFCLANISQDVYDKIKAVQKYSELSTEDPKVFLQSKNLKVVSAEPAALPKL